MRRTGSSPSAPSSAAGSPRDAPLMKDAVDSSIDHLLPWMPWAQSEPQTLEEKVELLRRFRGQFDLGRDFVMGIFDRGEERVLGGTGLHKRVGQDALEIGYWIRESDIGRGLATETTAALTRVAFEICGVDRVEIRIDPENERSFGDPAQARLRRGGDAAAAAARARGRRSARRRRLRSLQRGVRGVARVVGRDRGVRRPRRPRPLTIRENRARWRTRSSCPTWARG